VHGSAAAYDVHHCIIVRQTIYPENFNEMQTIA